MSHPSSAIMTAAIARYRGDATLQGLLTGSTTPTWNIFDGDAVPTNHPFPYVALYLPTSQSSEAETFTVDARDVYMQVSIFTQYAGFKQARGIAKQICALNYEQPLTLSGGLANVFIRLDSESEQPEDDGITQQIVQRWKLITQG